MDLGLDVGLPAVMELGSQIGESGRGERDSASLTQRRPSILLINRTRPRSTAALA
jgi:hypothetical protein